MLPTEDLFVYVYVLIHDLVTAGHIAVPPRPGPAPGGCQGLLLYFCAVLCAALAARGVAVWIGSSWTGFSDWSAWMASHGAELQPEMQPGQIAGRAFRCVRIVTAWTRSPGVWSPRWQPRQESSWRSCSG